MHLLTPSTVVSVRTITVWFIRALALFLLLRGAYLVAQRFLMGIIVGQPDMAWSMWQEIGAKSHYVSIGALMVVFGTVLALLNRRIAAWLTPAPPEGCPRCGFARGDDDPSRCTECGLPGVNGSRRAGSPPDPS
ncbi:MAG: hypothetical protein ACTS27_05720 [Phycisphaerales bacterium]